MNVVIIPCFDRPDFLTVCLELIQKAVNSDKYTYLFQIDFGHDKEVENVIAKFQLKKEVRYTQKHAFKNKQSYSLIQGYKNALDLGAKTIGLVEDDVFVANDFFVWHEKHLGDNYASIATKNHNENRPLSNDLKASYITHEYQSLGVFFNRSSVEEFVGEAKDIFFKNPAGFMRARFPKSNIGSYFAEQDGLIRRLVHEKKHNVIFPEVPRAFHAGFYGKSRGHKILGSLQDRILNIRYTAFDPSVMKGDSEPVLLINPII